MDLESRSISFYDILANEEEEEENYTPADEFALSHFYASRDVSFSLMTQGYYYDDNRKNNDKKRQRSETDNNQKLPDDNNDKKQKK